MPSELELEPGTGPEAGAPATTLPSGETDREGAMAKADLYKLANYAHKLFQQIQDEDQLEGWVQAKITKAADYIASVYHYLEYEMKFSEYGKQLDDSDVLSENQKAVLKNRLMEAKAKVKELKKAQAEKVKEDRKEVTKTQHGTATATYGDDGKRKGVVHKDERKYSDEEHGEAGSHVKSKSAAEKKADKEKDIKLPKHTGNTWGMKGGEKFGKKMEEGKAKCTCEEDGKSKCAVHGKVEEGNDGNLANNAKPYDKVTRGDVIAGRLGKDAMGGKKKKVKEVSEERCDECGMYESKCECDHVHEAAKPSAGLSKAKKSAVVKKAKKGGDIGKPGKSFDKVAKAAGGGEKGEKIAAAAMWKNIKETTAYVMEKEAEEKKAKKDLPGNQEEIDTDHDGKIEKSDLAALRAGKKEKETVKESAELNRMKQFLTRLNG